MFKNLWAPWDFFFQMTHSGVIDVAADRQTAMAAWEIQEMPSGVSNHGRRSHGQGEREDAGQTTSLHR
jgi:hypothetical protein